MTIDDNESAPLPDIRLLHQRGYDLRVWTNRQQECWQHAWSEAARRLRAQRGRKHVLPSGASQRDREAHEALAINLYAALLEALAAGVITLDTDIASFLRKL